MRSLAQPSAASLALAAALAACSGSTPARAEDTGWAVPEASARFEISVSTKPTHDSAGVIAVLPDGGLLPSPGPRLVVLDRRGAPLAAARLWHDPEQELALVFAAPASNTAVVYAAPGNALPPWSPGSNLTPSLVAFTLTGPAGPAGAHAIARALPDGRGVRFTRLQSLAAGPALSAPWAGGADYVLGYVTSVEQGQTWIAADGRNGARAELFLEGNLLRPEPRYGLPGGTGTWTDVFTPPNRVEMFAHRPAASSSVEMWWRPPGWVPQDLSSNAAAGAPLRAARPLYPSEVVRSGQGDVTDIALRDGAPAVAVSASPRGYARVEGVPVILLDLTARVFGSSDGVSLDWDFGGGRVLRGAGPLPWLCDGVPECRVEITARRADRATRLRRTVQAFCTNAAPLSLDRPEVRAAFRDAFSRLIEAVPPGTDPSASWSPRLWSLFSRLQRPGESAGPLNALFDRAWETWRGAMDVRERRRLEDALADVLGRENPRLALAWMDRFAQAEADALRAQQWKMKRGELLLYRLGDLDGAERFFRAVSPDAYPLVVRAQVRVGDIALLRGNLAEAQALYAAAGARSGRAEPPPKGLPDGAVAAQVPAAGPIAWPAPSQTGSATGFSARVRALIGVARYDDALRLLDEWELTSPAEKISGDFILLEATALVADGDAARADRMLAAYCGVAPESPILIQAVEMRKTCMERLGEPPAGIKAFEERVRKRTSGAPVRGSPRKDNER